MRETLTENRVVNPTAKTRFLQSNENISKHRQLVDSREFERGEDFAMREYLMQLMPYITDANTAAAVGLKLKGVHEFLQTFRGLSEVVRPPAVSKINDNLPEPN